MDAITAGASFFWGFVIWFAPYLLVVFGIFAVVEGSIQRIRWRKWLSIGLGIIIMICGVLLIAKEAGWIK